MLNLSTNIGSLIFFILGGNVLWKVGLAMMVGQTIGAYFGSHMVVKGGSKLIRPMIVLVCLAMLTKYVLAKETHYYLPQKPQSVCIGD